ncbi:MAG: DNA double-strand break repair nuclease NurA [Fervidicoccaceae archaeon]
MKGSDMSYIDDILEVASKKQDEIKRKIFLLGINEKEALEKISSGLVEIPSEIPAHLQPEKVAAVDGGSYPISMLGFEMYFIKSYSVRLVYNSSSKIYTEKEESRIVDVDILIPPSMSQDRITVYRQISEIRSMYDSLKMEFFTLADGSLESLIARPAHMKLKELDREDSSLCDIVSELIEKEERDDVAIASKGYIEREMSSNTERAKVIELVEKAVRLSRLFDMVAKGQYLAFVTKTGRSNNLFKLPLPDQYVLTKLVAGTGYIIETVSESLDAVIGQELSSLCNTRESARSVSFISGYARLSPGAPFLKIQLLSPFASEKGSLVKAYEELILKLASISIADGYPFPLLLAHQRAHIRKSAAEMIIDAFGFREELSGREEVDVL